MGRPAFTIMRNTPFIQLTEDNIQSVKNKAFNLDYETYYLKSVGNRYYYLINELIGSYLAKYMGLDTVTYQLARVPEHKQYEPFFALISKDFKEPNKKYLQLSALNSIYNLDMYTNIETNFDDIVNQIINLRKACKNDNNYKELVSDMLKMATLDFYMHQTDRKDENFLFKIDNKGCRLAPLFDYEFSFGACHTKIDCYERSIIYNSLNPNIELEPIYTKYPELKLLFEKLLYINMREVLKEIQDQHKIIIDHANITQHINYDNKQKELITRCLR